MAQEAMHAAGFEARTNKMAVARDRTPRCQVPGCSADLSAEPKAYCLRKRICTTHMQAEVLQYPGNQWCRYCFQCAKVEPLGLFDGNKKSCRLALHKRKVRPLIAAAAATSSAATATTPMFLMANTPPAPGSLVPCATMAASSDTLQQQQAELLLHMHYAQQQQQVVVPECLQSQLAAAASTLTAACNMTEQVAAAVAAAHAPHQLCQLTPAASYGQSASSSFAQQQQQQQARLLDAGCFMPSACDFASRTPSTCSSFTQVLSPADTTAATANVAAAAAAPAAPAASSDIATDSDVVPSADEVSLADIDSFDDSFDDFLDSLLKSDLDDKCDLAQLAHSGLAHDTSAAACPSNTCSSSSGPTASLASLPSGGSSGSGSAAAASLAARFPPFSCQPGTAVVASQELVLPCMFGSAAVKHKASEPMAMPSSSAAAAAAVPAVGVSGLLGGDCGLRLPFEQQLMQKSTAEQLQLLNSMLQQVQSSVLALAQNMQVA